MENNKPRKDRYSILDIGSSESEYEDQRNKTVAANNRAKTVVHSGGRTFSFERSEDDECSSNSYRTSLKSSDDDYEDIESLTQTKFGKNGDYALPLEKTQLKEKSKISNSKKAPKPPRPLKGPSLDTVDMQLVKDIAEQTMKRQARAERLKSLKKRRAVKSSPSPASSNISILAMVITVLFFLVIIFQGFGSGQVPNFSFDDPLKSTGAASSDLISIELGNNLLERDGAQQISRPPKKILKRKIYRATSGESVERRPDSDSDLS